MRKEPPAKMAEGLLSQGVVPSAPRATPDPLSLCSKGVTDSAGTAFLAKDQYQLPNPPPRVVTPEPGRARKKVAGAAQSGPALRSLPH